MSDTSAWPADLHRRPLGVDNSHFGVATCGDEVIGTCIVCGVAPQPLADTFLAARARGLPEGGLSTDTRTGALDLYLRLGMEVRHTVDCWTLPLIEVR